MLSLQEIAKGLISGLLVIFISLHTLSAQANDPYIKDLSVQHVQDRGVIVSWAATFNDTTSYFIIERSVDGQNFDKLGEIPSVNTQTSFRFIDRKPYTDISYYRIQVIDYDGNSFVSGLISLYLPTYGNPELVLFPMPVGNANTLNLNFQGVEKDFKANVSITDHFGRQVMSTEISINALNSQSSLDLNGILSAGNYQMTILGHSGQNFKIGKLIQIIQ